MERVLPDSASILVTEDCNLACTYCFEHHKKNVMTKQVAEDSLRFLAKNAITNHNDHFHAMIFGGEPLLNIDVVEHIFKKGLEIAKEYNIRFSANIITNATVMNNRIYNVLREYRDKVNLNIQLSVDGVKEVHDEYRITKAGKGSFDMVIKNIPKFQKLYDNNPKDRRLSIHGCVNHKSLPRLFESYTFFKYYLGFKQIWFLAIAEEDWTKEDVKIYRQQCDKIYNDILLELNKTKNIIEADYYAPFDKWRYVDQGFALPCSAGRSYVTITANGEIYPCHQIYFNDPNKTTKIGDIYNGIDEDKRRMFLEYDNSDFKGCIGCKNNNCYRCLAANWMVNGSIFSSIKNLHCAMTSVEYEYQKKLKEKLIEMGLFQDRHPVQLKKQDLPDCLCNLREGDIPIINNQENCQSGNNPANPNCMCDSRTTSEIKEKQVNDVDIIAEALELVINKLVDIENKIDNLGKSK